MISVLIIIGSVEDDLGTRLGVDVTRRNGSHDSDGALKNEQERSERESRRRESRRPSEDFQTDAFPVSLASFYTFLKGRKHNGKFESFMQILTQIWNDVSKTTKYVACFPLIFMQIINVSTTLIFVIEFVLYFSG